MAGLSIAMDSSGLAAKLARVQTALPPALKSSVASAAQMFEAEAKDLVHVVTGNLQEHIHTESVTDEAMTQVLMVTPIVEASNKYGFDPAYARRLEFGFIGTDSLGRHYHQPAFPYMRPARDNKQDAAREAIASGIQDAVSQAGGA